MKEMFFTPWGRMQRKSIHFGILDHEDFSQILISSHLISSHLISKNFYFDLFFPSRYRSFEVANPPFIAPKRSQILLYTPLSAIFLPLAISSLGGEVTP